jgi:large subunit ribosomal protein L30
MADTLKIKLVKGLAGSTKAQIAVVTSLGLRKIGDVTEQPNNAATAGKVHKVAHLVKVL